MEKQNYMISKPAHEIEGKSTSPIADRREFDIIEEIREGKLIRTLKNGKTKI